MKKTVLIYRQSLLPASETFIKLQASLIKEWNPILFGLEKSKNSLDLSGIQHHICTQESLTVWKKIYRKINRIVNKDAIDANILNQARALKPNLIHAHFAVDALGAYKIAKALGTKLIVTMHGYDVSIYPEFWASGQMGEDMRDYPSKLAKMANDPDVSFIAVSNAIKNIATNQFNIPAEKVKVIYLGINPVEFSPSPIPMEERPLKVLFVGRMVEKKAPNVLINAFEKVQREIPEAQLVMIGDGPMLEDMKTLVKRLSLNVEFMGAQPSSVVKSQLESSRIFCLPSIRAKSGDSEGLPIVLLEAQAMGVPVITSASGALNEGVESNATGVVFNENDSNKLTALLISLLTDIDQLTVMMSMGPKFIRAKHNALKLSSEIIALYNQRTK